jgi:aquaporin Z
MKYVYEFIGTFFLVLTVGMTVLEPHGMGVMAPLAIGATLLAFVFAGGHISGSHYNPAVSLAVFLRGKLSGRELGFYWIAQLVAGILAGYLTIYFKGKSPDVVLSLETFKAFLAEFLFTFALCYVVLNVATAKDTKGNSFFGLAVGFIVIGGAYAVGAVSSAAFNPAVALGITIMKLSSWSNIWIFFSANLLGGVASAYVFNYAHKKVPK